jgi:hypothetical protein
LDFAITTPLSFVSRTVIPWSRNSQFLSLKPDKARGHKPTPRSCVAHLWKPLFIIRDNLQVAIFTFSDLFPELNIGIRFPYYRTVNRKKV